MTGQTQTQTQTRRKTDDFKTVFAVAVAFALVFSLFVHLPKASAGEAKTALDISKGSITIENNKVTAKTSSGAAAAYNPHGYILSGTSTSNTVTIKGGEHHITLQSLKISTGYNGSSPISIENPNTKVTITLSGTDNQLTSGNPKKAAISVPEGTTLVLDTIDSSNQGALHTIGYGGTAAAIGGNESVTAGTIVVNHGKINATFARSGNKGAAIGGGQSGAGGTIIINDGIVSAESYSGSASAIGGGYSAGGYGGKATTVTINGGTVTTKIPNTAAYDSIGYGSVASAHRSAVENATSVIINGGHLFNKNDSNNLTSLLYKRQPVDGSGTTLFSTGIKVESLPSNGTLVRLDYNGSELTTTTVNGGYVYLFLPVGTQAVTATAIETGVAYYGTATTTASTASHPNSTGTVATTIKTAPSIAIVNDAADDTVLNDGKTSTLEVANLASIVNSGDYPLEYGTDYTVQWYKGSTPVAGNADDNTRLTVTPDKGDSYRARLVATNDGIAKGTSSYSGSQTALGAVDSGVPAVGVGTVLSVDTEATFTKQPDPTAGAITYTVKLTADDAAHTPIEGATVRFYQDGSKYPYTRVTGKGADAGVITFTFSALLPGEHAIKIAFDTAKINGVLYNESVYTKEFTVTKPKPPVGFTTVAAKTDTTNGKIYGVDETQEYIKWIPTIGNNQQIYPVVGNVIENVGPSLYSIRYKASYDGDVYQLASDYRYLVWVQTAQWTVTPVATDSVVWGTGPIDVVAGGSAEFYVAPIDGYEIKERDIQIKYADFSYDSSTNILRLSRITSDIRISIQATPIHEIE
ncbi:hypothetical protein EBB07_24900 [Paenibacillaceae bacterium]|nr:hypothetical protein EBB07_24900 [Paenibacillaceae bacterium]